MAVWPRGFYPVWDGFIYALRGSCCLFIFLVGSAVRCLFISRVLSMTGKLLPFIHSLGLRLGGKVVLHYGS